MPRVPGLKGEVVRAIRDMTKQEISSQEIVTMLTRGDRVRCHPSRAPELRAAINTWMPVIEDKALPDELVLFEEEGQAVGVVTLAEPAQGS